MYPGMIRSFGNTAIILIFALALAGCSKGTKTTLKTAPQNLPPDFSLLEKADQGISIGAPPGWVMLGAPKPKSVEPPPSPGSAGDSGAQFDKLMNSIDEESAAAIKKRVDSLEGKGIYVYAFNSGIKRIPGEEETRYIVKKESVGGNAQLQDVSDKIAKEVNGEMKPQSVELPIGKAVMVHGKVTRQDGGIVTTVTYGLVNGGDEYIVRFVTEEPLDMESIAASVMPTLRITK